MHTPVCWGSFLRVIKKYTGRKSSQKMAVKWGGQKANVRAHLRQHTRLYVCLFVVVRALVQLRVCVQTSPLCPGTLAYPKKLDVQDGTHAHAHTYCACLLHTIIYVMCVLITYNKFTPYVMCVLLLPITLGFELEHVHTVFKGSEIRPLTESVEECAHTSTWANEVQHPSKERPHTCVCPLQAHPYKHTHACTHFYKDK